MPSKLLLFSETGWAQPLILTRLSSLGVGVSRPVMSDRRERVDWPRQRHTQKKTVESVQMAVLSQLSQIRSLDGISYFICSKASNLSDHMPLSPSLPPLSLTHRVVSAWGWCGAARCGGASVRRRRQSHSRGRQAHSRRCQSHSRRRSAASNTPIS